MKTGSRYFLSGNIQDFWQAVLQEAVHGLSKLGLKA
jgi:hypothetical protein